MERPRSSTDRSSPLDVSATHPTSAPADAYLPRTTLEAELMATGDYFEGRSRVHRAADRLVRRLDELGISFAVAGGFALLPHGHRRYTDDVDILVRKEDWLRFKAAFVGLGYRQAFAGSKAVKDTEDDVIIEPLYTGAYPGDGKPKPIAYRDPADPSIVIKGGRYPLVTLATLIEMKIAAGMTSVGRRFKDYADAISLIRNNALPVGFATQLDPYVRETFLELHAMAQEPDQQDERESPE